ncbi:T9SS type A sorting domain-containing protein [Halpernia humi]|nr:T9SS type A sorting domain-containing protein [Halpernia humi]
MKKLYSLVAIAMFSATAIAQTTVAFDFSAQGYTNAQAVSAGTIDSNVSFTTAQNGSGTAPTYYNSGSALRFYANSADGNGNSITLVPTSGKEITDLVINSVSATYTPSLTYSVDGGAPVTIAATGSSYTISGINASSSLEVKNAVSGATTQLRIQTLSVTYTNSTLAVGDVNSTKVSLVKNTSVKNSLYFAAKANVQIVNTNGQVVKSAQVDNGTLLDVSGLAKGFYIVTGVVDGRKISQKIIKN